METSAFPPIFYYTQHMDELKKYWQLILIAALIATVGFGFGYLAANKNQRTPIIIEQGAVK